MPTHLYCLLPVAAAEALPRPFAGIDGGAVRALPVGRVAALVSTVGPPERYGRDAPVAHLDVGRRMTDLGWTPLVARYGEYFADDEACAAAVGAREDALAAELDRLDGYVEMLVNVVLPPHAGARGTAGQTPGPLVRGDDGGAGPGRAYLDVLKARQTAGRELAAGADAGRREVADAVRDLAAAEDVVVRPGPPAVLSVAHLVHRSRLEAYRAAIGALGAKYGRALASVGPYPPVSFAGAPAAIAVRSSRGLE